MKILTACEFSRVVAIEFEKKGHDVTSCDLLPAGQPGKHYQGDVRDILYQEWDMILAFPPCTYLANSGVCWLHYKPTGKSDINLDRWVKMIKSIMFFYLFLNQPCPKICIENPIQHGYARRYIRKYDQIIQPWWFGHEASKKTCLWLKGLPKLKPTKIVDKGKQYIYPDGRRTGGFCALMSGNKDQSKNRSRTFHGIAEAMAGQWG